MTHLSGLFAYPSKPGLIGGTVTAALASLHKRGLATRLNTWEENDIPGRFLVEPILQKITSGNVFVADVTSPNFNVAYEIGYAIACGKRAILVRNHALKDAHRSIGAGLFDTLGYATYASSDELADIIASVDRLDPLPVKRDQVNRRSPVYVLLPRIQTDFEIRMLARIKKTRLQFRNFDPEEQGRLPAGEAIDQTAQSFGVIVNLLSSLREGADEHNLRAAFVAGLAFGMKKALLILQEGDDPVPLDYRDLARSVRYPAQVNEYVADFHTQVTEAFQASAGQAPAVPESFLARLSLGAAAAENEIQDLGFYYIETDEYQRTLRGEIRVVAGRKGSGKTALFYRVRDQHLQHRQRVVLDLKPEGFQLLKFKERVLDYLEEGSKVHVVTAFWEYVLLLETVYRILRSDKTAHMRDNSLFEPYRALEELFNQDASIVDSDFSERLLKITDRISDRFREELPRDEGAQRLDNATLTELLYTHDVPELRRRVAEYLERKDGLWILMDNVDKGWPAHGLTEADVLTLRSLLDALNNIERQLNRLGVEAHGTVFVRNDVYELLVSGTSDRGKVSQVLLDWQDPDLLRELLRRRFVYSGVPDNPPFEEIWRTVAAPHVAGEESSQFLIERCLMRPRALLELLGLCKAHAVNLGHEQIEIGDFEKGEAEFSRKLFDDVSFELTDINPLAEDVLYQFIEAPPQLMGSEVRRRLEASGAASDLETVYELLLWFGVLGVVRQGEEADFIYDVGYDLRRLKALIENRGADQALLQLNPAFWSALEVVGDSS